MDTNDVVKKITDELTAEGAPFEIEEREVLGRRMKVWRHAPGTLGDLLRSGQDWGEITYLVQDDRRLSYAAHARAAASVARWLASEGRVRRGTRVAIASSNRIEWSVAFWGAAAAGAIVVPLNSWGTGEELEYALADSGSTVLFADASRLSRLEGRLESCIVVALDEPPAAFANAVRMGTIADSEAPFALPDVDLGPDDDATIFYTSGTTGRPKGAVGTHRNMLTNVYNLLFAGARAEALARATGATRPEAPNPPQESTLVTVPLFHATGCHATLVTAMAQGAKLVLAQRFDAAAAVDLIERERLTRLVGVPTTVQAVLDAGVGRDLSSITYVAFGGSPAPPALPRRIAEQLPKASFGVGYGLTESSANITTNIGTEYQEHPDSVGTTCPVLDVAVIDETGAVLPPGATGEIVVSGPSIVRGYWNRPEETDTAFPGGWLRTGDVGRIDDEGRIYLSDRIKDIIIRGGENVYCAEIENVLCDHPKVAYAAVVGRPHPTLGEEVVAFVTPGKEVPEAEELRSYVASRLAAFKVPATVIVSEEPLPRTSTGKLRKDVLRARLDERVRP